MPPHMSTRTRRTSGRTTLALDVCRLSHVLPYNVRAYVCAQGRLKGRVGVWLEERMPRPTCLVWRRCEHKVGWRDTAKTILVPFSTAV